ncbi:hypothetical protein RF11_10380 [Thelohanellus kitauei]|uniref:Uncharacterized protein n=1 Tax=Thelohanellus kitauei TaxID=669202 RepID=A0A0C2JTC0_THEKT|nr:hypothetical protein RF11_10380 [Thelohanellus kitauei]
MFSSATVLREFNCKLRRNMYDHDLADWHIPKAMINLTRETNIEIIIDFYANEFRFGTVALVGGGMWVDVWQVSLALPQPLHRLVPIWGVTLSHRNNVSIVIDVKLVQ